jgi:hypothetical protein
MGEMGDLGDGSLLAHSAKGVEAVEGMDSVNGNENVKVVEGIDSVDIDENAKVVEGDDTVATQ